MNRTRLVATLVAAGTVALPGTALAAQHPHIGSVVLYVATTGDDGHDCLAADAAHVCKTIQHAAIGAATGDTIQIAAGTYDETVAISASKSLTLIGAGGGTETSAAGATVVQADGSGPALSMKGGGTVSNLRLVGADGATATGALYLAANTATNRSYTVSGVVALAGKITSGSGPDGLLMEALDTSSHVTATISNSTIESTGPGGIAVDAGTDDVTSDITSTFSGVHVKGSYDGVRYQAFGGVSFSDSTIDGSAGILGIDSSAPLSVSHSVVRGGTSTGIEVVSHGSLTMVDSLVTAAPTAAGDVNSAVYIDNESAGTHTSAITGSTLVAVTTAASVPGLSVVTAAGSTENIALVADVVRVAGPDNVPVSGQKDIQVSAVGGIGTASVSASHSAFSSTGLGVSGPGLSTPVVGSPTNIAGNPGFAAWGSDYSLAATSPLIDKGDPAVVTANEKDVTDLTGRSLDGNADCTSTPDIGAYELNGHVGTLPTLTVSAPAVVGKKPATFTAAPSAGATVGWAFSNGGTATGTSVQHAFTTSGSASATATATSTPGCTATAARTFTVDATPPAVTKLKASPTSFKAAKSGTAVVTKGGTKVTLNVSEASTLTFTVEKVLKGRTAKGKCSAPSTKNVHGKSCTYYVKVAGSFTKAVTKGGAVTLRFSGRIGGHTLPKGSYRLDIIGTDALANKTAKPATATFRIT